MAEVPVNIQTNAAQAAAQIDTVQAAVKGVGDAAREAGEKGEGFAGLLKGGLETLLSPIHAVTEGFGAMLGEMKAVVEMELTMGAVEGLKAMTIGTLEAAGHMESLRITLTSVMHSAKDAGDTIQHFQEWAPVHGSLFTSTQLLNAFQQLKTLGGVTDNAEAMKLVEAAVAEATMNRQEGITPEHQLKTIIYQFAEDHARDKVDSRSQRSLYGVGVSTAKIIAAGEPDLSVPIGEANAKLAATQITLTKAREELAKTSGGRMVGGEKEAIGALAQVDAALNQRGAGGGIAANATGLDEAHLMGVHAALTKIVHAYDEVGKASHKVASMGTMKGQLEAQRESPEGVSFAAFEKGLFKDTETPEAKKLMDDRAKDYQGMQAAIADYWDILQTKFGEPILAPMEKAFQGIVDQMKKLIDGAKGWGTAVAGVFDNWIDSMKGGSLTERFGQIWQGMLTTAGHQFVIFTQTVIATFVNGLADGSISAVLASILGHLVSMALRAAGMMFTVVSQVMERLNAQIQVMMRDFLKGIPSAILNLALIGQSSETQKGVHDWLDSKDTAEDIVEKRRSSAVAPGQAFFTKAADEAQTAADSAGGEGVGKLFSGFKEQLGLARKDDSRDPSSQKGLDQLSQGGIGTAAGVTPEMKEAEATQRQTEADDAERVRKANDEAKRAGDLSRAQAALAAAVAATPTGAVDYDVATKEDKAEEKKEAREEAAADRKELADEARLHAAETKGLDRLNQDRAKPHSGKGGMWEANARDPVTNPYDFQSPQELAAEKAKSPLQKAMEGVKGAESTLQSARARDEALNPRPQHRVTDSERRDARYQAEKAESDLHDAQWKESQAKHGAIAKVARESKEATQQASFDAAGAAGKGDNSPEAMRARTSAASAQAARSRLEGARGEDLHKETDPKSQNQPVTEKLNELNKTLLAVKDYLAKVFEGSGSGTPATA